MKNAKRLMAIVLMLTMALSLCACGGSETAETEAPVVTEAPAVIETTAAETEAPAEEAAGGYTVTVLDENGNPVVGAMVQLCKDACVPALTDENGVAKFSLPEDDYKVSFTMMPAGYTYVDDVQEFHFEGGSTEMTIVIKAAE